MTSAKRTAELEGISSKNFGIKGTERHKHKEVKGRSRWHGRAQAQ
jgi:hypothetical protein